MEINPKDLASVQNYWKKYEGGIKGGVFQGEGILELLNGDVFKGKWVDGKIEGEGEYKCATG